MTLFGLSGILIGITSASLGVLVFAHNRNSPVNRVWALFAFAVAVWGFGGWAVSKAQSADDALIWWRVTHIGVILIPAVFTHFVHIFLAMPRRRAIYGAYLVSAAFLVANATPYFISHMRYVFGEFYYDSPPGILYASFVVFFFGLVAYNHYLLYRKYHEVSPEKQAQIRYFFLATAVGFAGGSTSFLPVFGIDIYPVLNFTVVLYPIIMAYAMLKHHLFEVKVVTAELLVVSILLAQGAEVFFARSQTEVFLRVIVFCVTFGLGSFAIRSVLREASVTEELRRLDRAKSEFVSIASHQLRTPLGTIKGYISLLQEGEYGTLGPKPTEALTIIDTVTNQLAKLVSELLDLSRIEAGHLQYRMAPFDLVALVQEVLRELRPKAENATVTVRLDEVPGYPLQVLGDADKIREVVRNLVDNAIKYSHPSGVVVVTIRQNRTLQVVRLSVQDTGIGMSTDELRQLFTKFSRAKEAARLDPNGMGIGLYFVKRIVEDHKGRVWAESDGPGKGSTFVVELPVREFE